MAQDASPQVVGSLPPDAMGIVGRRREVVEAKRLLSDTRLLMLTGVGGVGKTRLAIRVAAEVRRAFPDGVWLVELAALQDGDLLARNVAAALGLRDRSVRSSAETLVDFLQGKRLLLVLDNCEHLLEACAPLVEKLLGGAGGLRILATSREPLRAREEVVMALAPLSVPDRVEQVTPRTVAQYESVMLFMERARAVRPEFVISSENSSMLARLCRQLEGIPLALELAAVRLRALSLEQIVDRLDNRFRFLTQGYRSALPRHQTLKATVDWSYDLCSSAEQTLWARLSVFPAGFDLDAAEQVCSGDGIAHEDVLGLVTSLLEKSILIREDDDKIARYRLLETLNHYGQERLDESGGQTLYRRRHRDYYRQLAERANLNWFSQRQGDWFAMMRQELPNLRAALAFSLADTDRTEASLDIATKLYGYWVFNGAHSEARHWLDQALRKNKRSSPARFEALAVDATFALMQGEIDVALPMMNECREQIAHSDDGRSQALLKLLLGRASFLTGDLPRAIGELTEARDWYRENQKKLADNGSVNEAFFASFYLATSAAFLGCDGSADLAAECLKMAESADAPGEISMGRWVVGIDCWRAGDIEQAGALFKDSLHIDYVIGYRYSPVWSFEALAWAASAQKQYERSACLLGVADALRRSLGLSLEKFRPYALAHETCERQLRSALRHEKYATAFRFGAGLDFDEAIAYALDPDSPVQTQAEPPDPSTPSVLTRRELEVAQLVAEGMSNKEIAARLVVAQRTAEGHVENILVKLGFNSRVQIAAWILEHRNASR